MRRESYSILRFWAHDVLKQRTAVCETILAALTGRLRESVSASDLRFVYAGPSPTEPLTLNQRVTRHPTPDSNSHHRNLSL
jgi:hypothetical protein